MTAMALIRQLVFEGLRYAPAMPRLLRISLAGITFVASAVILAFMALIALLIAEYFYLLAFYSAPLAALGVACTALGLALLSGGTGLMLMKGRESRRAHRPAQTKNRQDIAQTLSALFDAMAEELEVPIRENPKTAVALAGLAGFLAGDQVRPP